MEEYEKFQMELAMPIPGHEPTASEEAEEAELFGAAMAQIG